MQDRAFIFFVGYDDKPSSLRPMPASTNRQEMSNYFSAFATWPARETDTLNQHQNLAQFLLV